MNVLDVIRGLVRRWYVSVPGLILAVCASVYMWQTTPSEYSRSGTLLLLPGTGLLPEDSTTNQFLYIGGLSPVADVLVRAMTGDAELKALSEEYGDAELTIVRDSTATGPIVLITVTVRSDALAAPLLDKALVLTTDKLEELQVEQHIVARDRVDMTTIAVEQESTVGIRDRLLLTALAGFGVTLFAVAVASLLDGLLSRARRSRGGGPRDRRSRRAQEEPQVSSQVDARTDGQDEAKPTTAIESVPLPEPDADSPAPLEEDGPRPAEVAEVFAVGRQVG